jgi:hypothetical protein
MFDHGYRCGCHEYQHAAIKRALTSVCVRACRLSQLRSVAGKAAPNRAALKALMNSDFDPDAWDQHMADVFDDEYYQEAEREDDVLCVPCKSRSLNCHALCLSESSFVGRGKG